MFICETSKEENQVKMVRKGKISIEENEIERERKADGNDSDHIVMVTLSGSHCHGHPIYGNTKLEYMTSLKEAIEMITNTMV